MQVADAIRRHINFDVTKCVLLASPGFVKEEFFDYLLAYARRESESIDGKSAKAILDNKGKFIIAHAASGHKSALTGTMHVLCDLLMAVKDCCLGAAIPPAVSFLG